MRRQKSRWKLKRSQGTYPHFRPSSPSETRQARKPEVVAPAQALDSLRQTLEQLLRTPMTPLQAGLARTGLQAAELLTVLMECQTGPAWPPEEAFRPSATVPFTSSGTVPDASGPNACLSDNKSRGGAQIEDGPFIQADEEIRHLGGKYLNNRRKDIDALNEALEHCDFTTIQTLGHRMEATGLGYGFPAITGIGRALDKAARTQNVQEIKDRIDLLGGYLKRFQTVG